MSLCSRSNLIRVNASRKLGSPNASRGSPGVWLEAGVHIKAVADLLGHGSISITGDLYGHTTPEQAKGAVEALAKLLAL